MGIGRLAPCLGPESLVGSEIPLLTAGSKHSASNHKKVRGARDRLSHRAVDWDGTLPPEQTGTMETGSYNTVSRPNASIRRPTLHTLRGSAEELDQLCCWGDECPTATFWGKIGRVCNHNSILGRIRKIDRVIQRDGVIRFDIFCEPGATERLLQYMKSHAHRLGWYTRRHQSREERTRRTPQRLGDPRTHPTSQQGQPQHPVTRFGTYNINGVRAKKPHLQRLLEKHEVACLALQETLLTTQDWRLRIPGYRCFGSDGRSGPSERGVALLLGKPLQGYVVGQSTSWYTLVRVFGPTLAQPWIVGSIYLPHSGSQGSCTRTMIVDMLEAEVVRLHQKFPQDPMLLMGDWNSTEEWVNRTVREWECHTLEVRSLGANETTRRGVHGRTIDHLVANELVGQSLQPPQVLYQWDLSDHFPVVSDVIQCVSDGARCINAPGRQQQREARDRFEVGRLKVPRTDTTEENWDPKFAGLVSSNLWDTLLDLESTDTGGEEMNGGTADPQHVADEAANIWVDTVYRVAKESDILTAPKPRRQRGLKRRIANAIDRRCRAFTAARRTTPGSEASAEAWGAYHEAKKVCAEKVRKESRNRWHRSIRKASIARRKDPKAFWQWASNLAGWRRRSSLMGTQPIVDPDTTQLVTDSQGINQAWQNHYKRLMSRGHRSRKARKYCRRLRHDRSTPTRQTLNEDISMGEILEALARMRTHKAPGEDGIPAEMLKVVSAAPDSKMGQALLRLVNFQWNRQVVPKKWQSSQMVSIPKQGDLTDMNNYRGISLMATSLKILMIIISNRLNSEFESCGLFTPAQAGFRKAEECATQVACLQELAQRRMIEKCRTYLVFVDFRKAYDMVPHKTLFAKLSKYGVRGRMLDYIKALYSSSTIQLRKLSGSDEEDTTPIRLRRGVRQGCPLSPVLFNIFINDIFDKARRHGIRCPGVGHSVQNIPGLLFADDLVGMAPTRKKLQKLMKCIDRWAQRNGMTIGVSKCGVMGVGEDSQRKLERSPQRWKLGGHAIPIVEQYTYLGINIHYQMQRHKMIASRLIKGHRVVLLVSPFLRCTSIPMNMRLAVVKTVVLPTLLYGAEVYGMNKAITSKMQGFLNQALRQVAGLGRNNPVSNVALWRELNVPPICASAASRRARALQKCRTELKTWVSVMAKSPMPDRKWTWVSGTFRWLNRYIRRLASRQHDLEHNANIQTLLSQGWLALEPKTLKKVVARLVWAREDAAGQSRTSRAYIEHRYQDQRVCDAAMMQSASIYQGMGYILRGRLGGFWLGQRLAKIGRLTSRYLSMCPSCGEQVAETLEHTMLHCTRWTAERAKFLRVRVADAEALAQGIAPGGAQDRVVVALLLGGEIEDGRKLADWEFRPADDEATTSNTADRSDNPETSTFAAESFRFGSLQVAGFLSAVMRARSPIIRVLRNPSQGSQYSFSAEGRSPNG